MKHLKAKTEDFDFLKEIGVANFFKVAAVDRQIGEVTLYKIEDAGEFYSLVIIFGDKQKRLWDIIQYVKENNLLDKIT